jgi:hypothetical protein
VQRRTGRALRKPSKKPAIGKRRKESAVDKISVGNAGKDETLFAFISDAQTSGSSEIKNFPQT